MYIHTHTRARRKFYIYSVPLAVRASRKRRFLPCKQCVYVAVNSFHATNDGNIPGN